jgi:hypothetical protein
MTQHPRFPRQARPIARSGTHPRRDTPQRKTLTVQQALEWAFGKEKARIELPPPPDGTDEPSGFGLEYILLHRAALGTRIDGGRHKLGSYTHPDAEIIAATVAALPDSLGGPRMAIRIAELARAGLTPDWMPGAVPRCVPVEMKRNQHGDRATSEVVGTERVMIRGKWRSVEVRACPVRYSPDQRQIDGARKAYEDWWRALGWVRDGLIAGRMLRYVEMISVMPRKTPWQTR